MWKIVAKDVVCVSYEEGDILAISDEEPEEPLPLWFFEPTWSENVSIFWPLSPQIGCGFRGEPRERENAIFCRQ